MRNEHAAHLSMDVDARDFLKKILNVRGKLIAEKKGNWSNGAVIDAYSHAKRWFNHWSPTSAQCAAYIKSNADQIRMIIPGPGCSAHECFIETYNTILS